MLEVSAQHWHCVLCVQVAMRSFTYGSLIGLLGIASAATYFVHANGISSPTALHQSMQTNLLPLRSIVRDWVLPFGQWSRDCCTNLMASVLECRTQVSIRRRTDILKPKMCNWYSRGVTASKLITEYSQLSLLNNYFYRVSSSGIREQRRFIKVHNILAGEV